MSPVPTSNAIRLLIVDDQAIVRSGYRLICQAAPDIEIVGEACNGHEAVEEARRLSPDVVAMDVQMPGLDGISATEAILTELGPSAPRIVVMTTFDLDDYVYGALKAGATSFLLKDAPPEDLIRAIRLAAKGDAMFAPSVTTALIERHVRPVASRRRADTATQTDEARPDETKAESYRLTDREYEVVRLIAQAKSNAEIADELCIAERTVKAHVTAILSKLELRDRVQVVVYAYEMGLVDS